MPDFLITRRVVIEQTLMVKGAESAQAAKRTLRQADREGRDGCDDDDEVQAVSFATVQRANIRYWKTKELPDAE